MAASLPPISPDRRPRVVIMLKEPVAGRVKTRLGRGIGMVPAAWWFRRQAQALIRRLGDPRWDLILAVSPDRAGLRSRVWPAGLPRIAQGPGDLGRRMGRVFRAVPPGPVVIVGADIPGLSRRHVAAAFRALGCGPSVLGPAEDGGYWLIGLRRSGAVPAALFRDVRWSGPHAMADTLRGLPRPVAMLCMLADVDVAADLSRVRPGRAS